MKKLNWELRWIFAAVSVLFAAFLLYPALLLLLKSFRDASGIGLMHYARILGEPEFLRAMGNSLLVSGATAAISTTLAFFLAYALLYTRIDRRVKTAIRMALLLPMFLPTITYGFAMIYSFGKQGLLTKLFGTEIFSVYGFWGLLAAYVIYTLPSAFLLLYHAFQYIDKNFVAVSKVMGDSAFRTFVNTSVRPLVGSLAAAAILVFFQSFTDFGIPASIGGEYGVVAMRLYNQMLGAVPDFGGGAAVAGLMLLPSVLSLLLLRFLDRYRFRYTKISRREPMKNRLRDGGLLVFSGSVALAIVMVFAVMFVVPFVKSWPYQMTFTFDHAARILNSGGILKVYGNSVTVAAATALLGTVVCYGAALVNARSSLPPLAKSCMDGFASAANTLPGMVLGIGFLFAFSGTGLQNTFAILVAANVVHFFATPYFMIQSSLAKMNASWETTGALMGDSWLTTLRRVVIPNSLSTVYEMLSYFFVNAMVTISAVVFITGAKTMVITAKIKELQHYEKYDEIFVLSLLIFFTNIAVKVAFDQLAKPREISLLQTLKNCVVWKERANETVR